MSYKYLDHEADVGILAVGDSQSEAFADGAKAMFNVMVDIGGVDKSKQVDIICKAESIDKLFVEWLNELIAQADINSMFFSDFKVEIAVVDDKFELSAIAFGEPIDQTKHKIKTEVKGATYYGLKYEEKENKFYVQCVLDV